MKTQRTRRLLVLWTWGLLLFTSCSRDLSVTVLYGQTHGLKPGDAVRLQEQQIGTVAAVEVTPQGRVAVHLLIRSSYRDKVMDTCRFIPLHDVPDRGRSVLELQCLEPGGVPLANGATVQGGTALGLLMKQGRRSLRAWTDRFESEMDRWKQRLEQLPVEAWITQLESRLDDWTRELEEAGEETRRSFTREILPRLEEALQALKRRLSEHERHEDMERLERKFEGLKRT